MAIIYSYPLNTPKPADLLIGTITYDESDNNSPKNNPTVSFTVQSLLDLVGAGGGNQNLQQVTNFGATTNKVITITNDINVSGRYYDSSGQAGVAGRILSSTNVGTQWIDNTAQGITSIGLSMPAAFTVANSPITTFGTLAVTANGNNTQFIDGSGNLQLISSIPNSYTLPLAASGTRGGIQIGYTELGKNYPLELSNEKGFVSVPWTDTVYSLPAATNAALGGIKIGYIDNGKNYAVELDGDSEAFVNVPWTDTVYTLPLAADGTRGGVQIGYTTNAAARNYAVTLATEKMLVNVPWTDTQNADQTIAGSGSSNTDSGITLSASGGTVLVLGDGSVTAAQSGNKITLTGVNTWVANAVTVAGYVAAPAASDANLVWKTNGSGVPAWRADATIPDTGVTSVTVGVGANETVPLLQSITGRELTLTSNVYGGGAKVGFVPSGGTSALYLKGDGTWAAVPTGLQFKGTWDASGGGGGNPDLTLAANQGDGFLWITNVAGTAYPNGGSLAPSTWNVGDWAVYVGAAGSGSWTRVPATNSGVTSVTTTDGTYVDLTPNAATTGAVTVTADLSAADGTSDVNTKFLSKDNTWDVPSYTGAGVTTFTSVEGTYIDITDNTAATGAVGLGTVDLNAVNGTSVVGTRFLSKDNTWDVPSYTTNTNTTYDFLAIEAVPTATVNTTPPMGTGYTSAVNAATTGGSGSGMTVDTVVASGGVQTVIINKPGTGYAIGDNNIVISGGNGNAIITLAGSVGNINPNLRLIDQAFGFDDVKLTGAGTTTITRTADTGITFTSTDTQENTTWYIRDSVDSDKTVNNSKYLKFVTATGTLGTALSGAGTTGDPYLMTLTSPNTNTQNTYTAGAGLSLSSFAFSADIDTTAANDDTVGLVATADRFYAVQLDNNSTAADRKMVVNVPWVSGGSYSWKVRDNASTPLTKTVLTGEFLQFKTATGALATDITGTGATGTPYVMTLTSPNDNTTYSLVSTSANGLAPQLPAAVGGKFLRADATWVVPPDTTYSDFGVSTAAAVGTAGLVPAPAAGTQGGTYYLNGNKSFSIPPNTTYSNFTTATASDAGLPGLVPGPAATYQNRFLRGDATWVVPTDTQPITYTISIAEPGSSNTNVTITPSSGTASTIQLTAGTFIKTTPSAASAQTTLDLSASGTASSSNFLRGDNAWATPANDNTTYTAGTGLSLSGTNVFSISSAVVTLTGTQTLTNKTLTSPAIDEIVPSAALLTIKGVGSTDAGIKLNCYVNSHGQTLKAQPHSAGVTNTMLLPPGANSTLVSNVSASAFTNKTGSNNQWTNDAGYTTNAGTVTPSSTDTFTNKSGNISMWTNNSGYTTNTGTTTASNTQTFTNKSGNISQWTNNSGYITSYTETDTLATVTGRGATTATATSFTNTVTLSGSGTNAYFYITGNAGPSVPLNSFSQGLAFAYNNSNGSRETDMFVGTGAGATAANNAASYFGIYNRFNPSGTPTDTLNFKFYGNGDMDITGTFTATGDVVAYSDERLKSNIKTLDGSKVYEMRGVSFNKHGKKGSGVIAQEMEKVAPELVKDGEYKGVAYGNISGYLIEAIKDLKAEIEELKNKPCNCNCK